MNSVFSEPEHSDATGLPAHSLSEARVLGVLIEKQRTVPDTYPLSLNALLAGCNQKTSRDPVLELSESEVLSALDGLKAQDYILESSGGRVTRFGHNAERVLRLPSQAVAIVAVLLLRGPQTPAELRANCDRLHRFADISAVEGFLEELATRPAGALVTQLPRQPGTRETRWAQLLTGRPLAEAFQAPGSPSAPREANLEQRLALLEAEVAIMKESLARLLARPDSNSL